MSKSRPTLISTPAITEIELRDEIFLVTIQGYANDGGGLGKLGATHAFPLDDLRKGASLARLMTLSIRAFLKQDKCQDLTEVQIQAFRDLATEAITALRPMVEQRLARETATRLGMLSDLRAALLNKVTK